MLNKRNTSWLPLAAILALFAAAFLAAPVFAQDEAPAEPAPEAIPLEETPPVEVLPAELPEGVALAVENESGEAISLASEEAAQILAEGDPWFKVGTVEYNFTTSDCDPIAGGNQPCANPIQAAINWVRDNATIPSDGTIYIEYIPAPYFYGMPILVDGSNVNVNKLKGLQGSLDAATNLPNVLLNSKITINNKTIPFILSGMNITGTVDGAALVEFTNNSGAMTLQDMVISNNSAMAGSSGLSMNQIGAITLNRVNISNNPINGAVLDNDAGIAGITITNSSFEYNSNLGGAALTISSKGAVLLNNVSFYQNPQGGLLTLTTKSLMIKNSTFVNNGDLLNHALTVQPGSAGLAWIENSVFRNSYQDAMHIDLAGDVTLKNLNVESSGRHGAYINTCAPGVTPGTACTLAGNGNVTVTGSRFYYNHQSSDFQQDGEAALYVWAKGAITLSDVIVSSSGYYSTSSNNALTYGAHLYNADAPSAKNVTVNKSEFAYNTDSGLYIRTRGSVSMSNLNVQWNYISAAHDPGIHGVDIDASFGTGSVTLSDTLGSNSFGRNDGDGLHIVAKGSVSLTNLQSNYNAYGASYMDGRGVYINNSAGTGSVTLKKVSTFYNNNSGVEILTNGSVTLDTGEHQYNGQSLVGSAIKIGDPSTPAGAVTLKNLLISYNYVDGLTVHTKSNVLMDYIDLYQQQGTGNPGGASINASYGTGTVTLQNKVAAGVGSLNRFSNNPSFGLQIWAKGKVSLSDANINNNAGGDGLFIDNSVGTGDVLLTRIYSEYNREDGIQILSAGNVSLTTGYSENNGNGGAFGFGVRIDNTPALTAKTVTITNFGGNYNKDLGFWVRSNGAINLKSIAAYGNGNASATFNPAGALFDNTSGIAAGVTMTRAVNQNVFASHFTAGMPGLRVLSNGAVSLSSVLAYSNDIAGVIINNDYAGKTGGVTLADLDVYSNDEQNLVVNTNGAVKLTGGSFSSSSSTLPNVEIYSLPSTTALPAISISKVDIWGSGGTGLYIEAKGSITLNAVTSNGNGGIGMELYNQTGSGGVSILGTLGANEVETNSLEGLKIQSKGAIILSKLDVYNNGTSGSGSGPAIHGAILNNSYGTADVTLTNVDITTNVYGSGAQISTLGKVTWTGGEIGSNGYNLTAGAPGVWITNQPAVFDPLAPAKTITLTNLDIHDNGGDGLVVSATGAITLSGVKVYDQTSSTVNYVASLDNSAYSGGVTISGTGNQFNGYANLVNLLIATKGKVSLANLEVRSGDRRGIEIDNKAGKQDVIITNAFINGNGRDGLTILSLGNITLTGVTASSNGSSNVYYNALLDNNDDALIIKNVTINKCNFDYGNGNGLYVVTNGNILVNKISASNHSNTDAFGVYLENTWGTGYISILSTYGANTISNNYSGNLYVYSNGAVTINGLTASNSSHSSGVTITNVTAPVGSYPGVTVSNSTFDYNAGNGLEVSTKGAITLSSVTGQSSTLSNVKLDNHWDDTNTKAITVTKSTFYGGAGSGGAGLNITASAAVILNTVSAENSNRDGVLINAPNGAVTVSGTNVFSGNSYTGLYITANGMVTISNITANDNNDFGLYIDTTKAITITNAVLKRNTDQGIWASAGGNINITGLNAMLNGNDGVRLSATGYNITITNGIVTANGANGIEAYTGATNTLTLKNTLWAGNGYPYNPTIPDLVYDGLLLIQ